MVKYIEGSLFICNLLILEVFLDIGNICNCKDCGDYALIEDVEDPRLAKFDRPLPIFGCGIGWGA